jgi:rod shape-determining protein MreC
MFARSLGPGARLAIWLAVGLLFVVADVRYHALDGLRGVLTGIVTPARHAAVAPGNMAGEMGGFFTRHRSLQTERDTLAARQAVMQRQLNTLRDTERENAELRRLLGLAARTPVKGVAADVLQQGRGWFTQTLVLDQGAAAGVVAGQAVVDADGLIGQVVRVYRGASEAVLLTQSGHLTPVYVGRTGQRGLAAGEGAGRLALRYIPQHADIRVGDRLLTSGIDRVYPAGVPVARVTEVARLQNTPYLRIACVPLAGVERSRVVRVLQAPAPGSAALRYPDEPPLPLAPLPMNPLPPSPAANPVAKPASNAALPGVAGGVAPGSSVPTPAAPHSAVAPARP